MDSLFKRREQLCKKNAIKAQKHPKFTNWFKKYKKPFPTRGKSSKYCEIRARTERFKKSPINFLINILNNQGMWILWKLTYTYNTLYTAYKFNTYDGLCIIVTVNYRFTTIWFTYNAEMHFTIFCNPYHETNKPIIIIYYYYYRGHFETS